MNSERGLVVVAVAGAVAMMPPAAPAGIIGVDAVHGFSAPDIFAFGSAFDTFRSTITGLGHTIVPLNFFQAADLAGLDGLILQ